MIWTEFAVSYKSWAVLTSMFSVSKSEVGYHVHWWNKRRAHYQAEELVILTYMPAFNLMS